MSTVGAAGTAIRFRAATAPTGTADDWPGPIDLDIEEGEFCVLTAPPSITWALMRLCVGLRAPGSGTVEVLGLRPAELGRWQTQAFRRRLGVAFTDPAGLVSNLTVKLNVIVPILYSGAADQSEATRRAEETITACGIERWANVRPADLPLEVRRKAVIARAIARGPELLLLEEPIASLRDAEAKALLQLCRERSRTIFALTAEDEGPLVEYATRRATLDENGLEVHNHEVGIR